MSNKQDYIHWDTPNVEPPIKDEAAKIHHIQQTMNKMQQHNFAHHRHGFRCTHVKTQGIAKGTLIISPDLPNHLAQGIASKRGAEHPVAIRFANEPSFLQDDRAPGPRGCGMKVFNVEADSEAWLDPVGERTRTQDLTFNNSPVLELKTIPTTAEIVDIRERNFDDGDGLQKEIEARDDKDLQFAPAGLPNRHFLSYEMYSQSAYRWGPYIAKYALFPSTSTQQNLASSHQISDSSDRDQHALWLRDYFKDNSAEYDFRIQLCRDLDEQSVEDCSVDWDQSRYPFGIVGRVTLPAGQDVMDSRRRTFWEERMKLNVWYGLQAHRPLGSTNRLRKEVYKASVNKREDINAMEVKEVKSIDEIP